MGQDSRGVMTVSLTEQLIELNAVVKPSRREFKSSSWNIYIEISMLFILYYYFYCSRFYCIYLLYHFAGMRFFQTLRYIRIKYIRIHEQTATTW